MKLTDITVSTFWKGEYGIKSLVTDGDRQYQVKLSAKGSQIRDYSCSCVDGNSFCGMCRHSELVWEAFLQKLANREKHVITSQEVRTMIREYTNREVEQIIMEDGEEPVSLVPQLIVSRDEVRLELKLGRERMYILRDLLSFTKAVENGNAVEYGKGLAFHHHLTQFTEDSRELVLFVSELVNICQDYLGQFKNGSRKAQTVLRTLKLNRSNLDRFFCLVKGRKLEIEYGGAGKQEAAVIAGLPDLVIQAARTGSDGIRVSIDKRWYCLEGEQGLYIGNDKAIYCVEERESRDLRIFLRQMTRSLSGNREVVVQERDVPLFYERVLLKVGAYCRLETQPELVLEEYKPEELKARFEFDSRRPDEIILHPVLSYGSYSFHPVEDDRVPGNICRNVPGEFRISRVITKYFKHREGDSGNPVIRGDEEAIYELVTNGIREFHSLGEVVMTGSASHLRLVEPERVHVEVCYDGSWLNLTVEADGISTAEFNRILSVYRKKRPYYRRPNGEFLQLTDSGLMRVAELAAEFSLSRKDFQGKTFRLPAYRALYLDEIFRNSNHITLYRDQLFKALVRGMKSAEDSDFEVPEALREVLRGYQKSGFLWLKTLDAHGFGGILADDMGLGKTIQVISILLDEAMKKNGAVSLVVCPASLVFNWENEVHTFAPGLRVQAVSGTASERQEQLLNEARPDVYITSYDLLKRDIAWYQQIEFRFQIIDEAQYIKNAGTQTARAVKSIHSRTRFALTGTPVENRLAELWSIFDFLMPGYLFSYRRFKECYEMPVNKGEEHRALERLRLMIGPFVLRRLKKDVLKGLPEKLEAVVYSKLQGEQKKLYMAHAMALKERLAAIGPDEYQAGRLQILAELMRLRQICCDPSLCFEDYRSESAKLSACLELVQSGVLGGHKILIFSQFTSMLDIIRERLTESGISCYMLTGQTVKEKRLHMVRSFQTDDIPVFLISLKAGGTGLNLTAADIVLHYDPWWNVAAQNQAADRAHRIGQEKQVSVFQLIAKDTIEENICLLQKQKQYLADQVITGDTISFGQLTRDTLMSILQ